MKTWHRFTLAAVACAAGLTAACSGKTVGGAGGDGGGSSGSSSGGSSGGGCDDYFETVYGGECSGMGSLPASELTRIQARFATLCADAIALPGIGITDSALEACVSAVKSGGCGVLEQDPGPCSLDTGTLSTGATCVAGAQCLQGDCTAESESADGGQTLCGTCVAPVPPGQSCANGLSCGPTALCNGNTSGGETCVTVTYGAAGAACNGSTTQCNAGLHCDPTTQVCAPAGGAGAACETDSACMSPLVCPAVAGASTCQSPGGAGTTCADDVDCAAGLGCGQLSHQCVTLTFATSGGACSDTVRCLVGGCDLTGTATTGTCPLVIPDGQPCTEDPTTATCDTFASCEGGLCVLGYPTCP